VENDLQDLLAEPLTVMVCAFLRLASQLRDANSWSLEIYSLWNSPMVSRDS
jgi:hypothetical protein